jgi:hypothetical protein
MDGMSLLAEARAAGLTVRAERGKLIVRGPKTLEPLALRVLEQKGAVMQALCAPSTSPLAEWAASAPGMPKVCFTLRETDDSGTDAAWLQRIRKLIEEHQPGNNRIVMTIFTLDGRKVYAEWRAVASRELRTDIARILVQRTLDIRTGKKL